MKLRKRRQQLAAAPKTAYGVPALAWTDNLGTIFYVVPGRRRFAHEAAHNLRGEGNEMHHPWWHFCVLVGHLFRLTDAHATQQELAVAEHLLGSDDDVDLSVAVAMSTPSG